MSTAFLIGQKLTYNSFACNGGVTCTLYIQVDVKRSVCNKIILVYIADNMIVDTGKYLSQNEIVFQIQFEFVSKFVLK